MEASKVTLKEKISELIRCHPGITQKEMRERTGAHQVSVVRTLRDLQRVGAIEAQVDDARIKHYVVSTNGCVVSRARDIGGHFGILMAQVMA